MILKENTPSVLFQIVEVQKKKERCEKFASIVYKSYYELLRKFGVKEEGSDSRGPGTPSDKTIYWRLKETKFDKRDYKLKISVRNDKYHFPPDEKKQNEPKETPISIDISCFKKNDKVLPILDRKEKPLSVLSLCLESEGKFNLVGDNRYKDDIIALEDFLNLALPIEEKLSKK